MEAIYCVLGNSQNGQSNVNQSIHANDDRIHLNEDSERIKLLLKLGAARVSISN